MGEKRIPNKRLKHEREQRGWSQEKLAEQVGTSFENISRWERGITIPQPHFREKLCKLFGKNALELGLIQHEESFDPPEDIASFTSSLQLANKTPSEQSSTTLLLDTAGYNGLYPQEGTTLPGERGEPPAVRSVPMVLIPTHQVVDLLRNAPDTLSLGALLACEANELTAFFDEGWSVDELLESLRVVLQGVQAMPKITRRTFGRKLLQFGAIAAVSGIPILSGKYISAEDRNHLHSALGESIAAGWKLFHTASNSQVLAVGQAQLYLVQQNQSLLYPTMQPLFYSGVYRLIGAAQHFQGRYEEAYQAHEKAYIAALEGADAWNMAQSRMWQTSALKERGHYTQALQLIEGALRLVSVQTDIESIRTTAHLLASGAEIAALMDDEEGVKLRLCASEELLAHLPGQHEEFDRAAWHEISGVCALHLKRYGLAVSHLEQAIKILPTQSTLRHVNALVPLVMAYANTHEQALSITTAEKALPLVRTIHAPDLDNRFMRYTRCALLGAFPDNSHVDAFIASVEQQFEPRKAISAMIC